MDNQDQTQDPFDPSATQALPDRRRRNPAPRADNPAKNVPPVTNETDQTQNIQSQPSPTRARENGARQGKPSQQSTHLLPNSPIDLAHQPTMPQPILFSEMEVDVILLEEPLAPLPKFPPLRRTRRWLRSRSGRIVIPVVALILGIVLGLSSLLWLGLSGAGPVVLVPSTTRGNLIVEVDKDFLTQLVQQNLSGSNLPIPGQLVNENVALQSGAQMTITADDVYTVMGLSLSRKLTIIVQPYIQSCTMQTRVTHVDLGGVELTGFAQSFAGDINSQFSIKSTDLPKGFTYCTVNVHTQSAGLFITYQATPIKK